MAESARQEIELTVGGKTFSVRPDFVTISNIEAATQQPARTLGLQAYAAGVPQSARGGFPEISMTNLVLVIFWMLRGKKDAPATVEAVGEIIMEEGYGDLLMPVGNFLTRAQRGNKEHEKEAAQGAPADPPSKPN